MLLTQALNQASLKNPGAAALLDLGKTTSYSELRKKISQLSFLYQAEIGHGHRIGFLCQNTPALVVTFFAFSNLNCPCIFFDPTETPEEIVQAVRDLELTHLCVSNDQAHRANELIRAYGLNLVVVEIEKKKGGEYDTSFSPPPDHPLKETDPVLILRQESHGQPTKYLFFHHDQAYAATVAVRRFYHFGANEALMTTLSWADPFAFVHGLLLPLLSGVTCAVNPQCPTNEEFVEYLAQHRITRFVDQPKFYYWLLSVCMAAKYRLPGLKSVTVGEGTLSKAIRKAFGLLKVPVLQTYGRVEALWTLAMEDAERSGTNTLEALPGFRYKVLNAEGDELPGPGMREGPLAITSEALMTAFFHPEKSVAEKATKLAIRGTWFYTGEAARLEGENDELKIRPLGSLTEVLVSGDRFLSPERLDATAAELNDVIEAAGFVRLDEKNVPSFALAVVRQGKTLSEAQLLQHVKAKLPGKEHPATVHFVDSLPKNKFGVVNRTALQRQFSAR